MSSDISRLAARRQAAQRRNARRIADAEMDEDARAGVGGDDDAEAREQRLLDADLGSARLVGTAFDADDARAGVQGAAHKAIQSAHDERRAINQRIYGRLNVVEDERGFVPSSFVSSRNARAAAATAAAADAAASTLAQASSAPKAQSVQDFMDEEDLAEGGAAGQTSLKARTGAGAAAASSSSLARGSELVAPAAANSIALQLLKSMGWRKKKPAGDGERSAKKARVYGAMLPPGMKLSGSNGSGGADDDDDVDGVSDLVAFTRLMDGSAGDEAELGLGTPVYTSAAKQDTAGLGFVPYSQLSAAARARVDRDGVQSLTFVRAKQAPSALAPKEYSIEVPADFDGKHYFPLPEPEDRDHDDERVEQQRIAAAWNAPSRSAAATAVTPAAPARSAATTLISAWASQMNAARQHRLDLSSIPGTLPMPPPPRPPQPITAPPTAAPATPAASVTASAATGPSALDLQRQRRLEAMEQAERGGGGGGGASNNRGFVAPGTWTSTPSHGMPQQPTLAAPGPGGVDIQAAIAAAREKAQAMLAERQREARKAERKARWGPLPDTASTGAAPSAAAVPLAAAFLSATFGADSQLALPPASTTAPDSAALALHSASALSAPDSSTTSVAPSLSVSFPNFVMAGEFDPASGASSSALSSDTSAAATSTIAVLAPGMSNFVEAGEVAPSTAAAVAPTTGPTILGAPLSAGQIVSESERTSAIEALAAGPYADYFAAARAKQFGRLTRRVEDWTPHNLVYKRFGVPLPKRSTGGARNARSEEAAKSGSGMPAAQGTAVPGFPSFVQSATMLGGTDSSASGLELPQSAATAAPPTDLAAIVAEIAAEEEAAIQADLARDEAELYDDQGTSVGATAAEGAPDAVDEPAVKPSLDLFKAIFEADSEEEQPERKRKQRAKPAPTPTAPAAVPSATKLEAESTQMVTTSKPSAATPSTSSGFVHPDRQRLVPSSSPSAPTSASLSAAGVASLFDAHPPTAAPASGRNASNAAPSFRPQSSSRQVISLDDDDDDSALFSGQTAPVHGFKGTRHAGGGSATAFKNDLEFVPASGRPAQFSTRGRGRDHSRGGGAAAACGGLATRGGRFGAAGGEDDDEYGYDGSSKPFASVGKGRSTLHQLAEEEEEQRRNDEPLVLPRRDAFKPPPVAPPRAATVLPPPVAASWPFVSPLTREEQAKPLIPAPAKNASSSTGVAAAPISAPAAAAAAPAASDVLLSQLLNLHKVHKEARRRERRSKKEHSRSGSRSHSRSDSSRSRERKRERKAKKEHKRESKKSHKKHSQHKEHKKGSSSSSSKHRSRERTTVSSNSSSSDSDVQELKR